LVVKCKTKPQIATNHPQIIWPQTPAVCSQKTAIITQLKPAKVLPTSSKHAAQNKPQTTNFAKVCLVVLSSFFFWCRQSQLPPTHYYPPNQLCAATKRQQTHVLKSSWNPCKKCVLCCLFLLWTRTIKKI